MKAPNFIRKLLGVKEVASHLRKGQLGEEAAQRYLRKQGYKFLTKNFRGRKGELDLLFRFEECLVFVEVKTRSSEEWTRPSKAVNARKKKLICKTAFEYLNGLKSRHIKIRFDIVEVLLRDEVVSEIRHLPDSFPIQKPNRYG